MASEYPIPEKFRALIMVLVHQLVVKNYDGLVEEGKAGPFTAELLEAVINRYGRTLVDLPVDVWECPNSEAYPLKRQEWAIDVALWTMEEGYSDLTLMLDIKENDDHIALQIIDIRVP